MVMAWRFWRTTRRAFAECLKLAWRNFTLVQRMQTQVVRFFFQKVDSTLREAWGTLRSDILPPRAVESSSCILRKFPLGELR